jgi:hypothetical protein
VFTNDVSDSYQEIYVIAHIICNHGVFCHPFVTRVIDVLLTAHCDHASAIGSEDGAQNWGAVTDRGGKASSNSSIHGFHYLQFYILH